MGSTGSRRTFFLCALASLAAVAAGAAIMAAAGLPFTSWLRNPAAWVVGAVFGFAMLLAGRGPWVPKAVVAAAAAGLAATLFAEPQDGIRRWVDLGPLHVNMATLLLPPTVVALTLGGLREGARLAAAAAIALLLILQPDASQATAFALAASIPLLSRAGTGKARLAIGAAGLVAVAAAWLRPDRLEPVAEVEEIFQLAWDSAPALAAVAALALASACLAPLALKRAAGEEPRDAALALSAYMAAASLCPALGAYPVPLVGLGMSFVVGYWLAAGLLCARTSALNVPGPGR